MTDRILDISDQPARLRLECGNLVIESQDAGVARIPIGDLAGVVLSHPRITVSQAALDALASARVCVVTCNGRRLPTGMLLPLASHSTQTERFAQQAALRKPVRKRLWQQLVTAKIRAQARTLAAVRGHSAGLDALARRVRSGDPDNLEAQAAQRYWRALFPGGFRRSREGGDRNPHLNYGYAVLRSLATRALAGAGLHPSLGVHHHNRYNPFCLADDLMEPFRPLVDLVVARLPELQEEGLSREDRKAILGALAGRYRASGEHRTLFDWIARSAWSLRAVVAGGPARLDLPEIEVP